MTKIPEMRYAKLLDPTEVIDTFNPNGKLTLHSFRLLG